MTKVLVVDDSALMRRLMGNLLGEAGFQVQTARNGAEGVIKLGEFQPDVVTLDVNMPEMDGLTALSLMMQARPTPVVMVSSLTTRGAQATLEALALGAVDFVAKPGGTISLSMEEVADQLVAKVRAAARARLRPARLRGATTVAGGIRRPDGPSAIDQPPGIAPDTATQARAEAGPTAHLPRQQLGGRGSAQTGSCLGRPVEVSGLVLVGVSTGGPRTLEDILPRLPTGFPWPVLVAQHMPAHFTDAFARRMDAQCALRVVEVAEAQPIEAGTIYLGRGGTDMVVTERLGRLLVQPRAETPGHPWHPSVDVLVQSALRHLPPERLVGVLLTGMGNDGARSMHELHSHGGRTIAESVESAVVFGMPRELIELDGADLVLPCQAIGSQLVDWVCQSAMERQV